MNAEKKKYEFSPKWAQHVDGYYYEREFDPETKQPEETECGAKCRICGATFKKMCLSGMFRTHIANFATVHLHRDPLAEKKT